MDNTRGIALMVFSMLFFAFSDAVIKYSSAEITASQMLFWLGVGGTALFSVICLAKKQSPFPGDFLAPTMILRSTSEGVATFCVFTALALIPLTTLSAILQATPIVVALGGVIFLGEKVGLWRWAAIFAGFVFVMIIIRPGFADFDPNTIFAAIGVIGLSIRDLTARKMRGRLSPWQLSVMGYALLIPTALICGSWQSTPIAIRVMDVPAIGMILATSALAYVSLAKSVQMAEMAVVAPYRYSRLIFALVIGVILFHERPDFWTLFGAAGVILSGLIVLLREHRKPALSPPPPTG